ncbi:redoxin domain-containing protein [Mucilaginibacter limnophilus]|uniref:Redoxin domain-containing protein n=1 Tax=Mucilaginibacter limnophilus TaxID=1932778 RepID=A0A437MZ54_9SPHI|nr:redoxin domain-containing protein [Mucilaginibacter limnophilus]RVU02928.1 redoxin domain-containing protein [Mucilaginibacter limnophilus]
MKNIKTLSAILLSVWTFKGYAQTGERLKLSTATPAAGQKITFTYDTAGAALGAKPEATVHFLNKDYPVADIDLAAQGKGFTGDFTIPATAKAFYLKFKGSGDNVDNNGGQGYIYEVYKNGKPVESAYASEAYLISTGMGNYFAKIEADKARAAELYKKEFTLHPQSEPEYISEYIPFLIVSKDAGDNALANKKLEALKKKGDEKSLTALNAIYARLRKKAEADSVGNILVAKYPNSRFAKDQAADTFSREKDLVKKEALLKAYFAKNPDNAENKKINDNLRTIMASSYLKAGDMQGYEKYAAQISNKANLAGSLNNIAYDWATGNQRLDDAAKLSQQSLQILDAAYANVINNPFQSPKQAKAINRADYYNYADTYAYILYKQGKLNEALKYQQMAYDSIGYDNPEINEHYALILNASGNTAKAKQVAEKSIKTGKGSQALKDELKKIYIKEKGSEKGFDDYIASLNGAAKDKMRDDLAKTMINETAPVFTLKDFNGNAVSLASLKGKVVVLDFWATWCGPCKASFPGMQMAVNKYKDNPNVKFLFIDTWENGDNFLPNVKKFIADNKYTFHVLIDEKTEDGSQSKVVSSYKVDGIPTKFVIDQNGNIRFKHVGFSGSSEGVLEEVSAMVDMLVKPTETEKSR